MTRINYKVKDVDRKIEMFDGRPDRDEDICQEDFLNLVIAMEAPAPKGHDPLHYFLYLT
jgi:hypothetical protein